MFLIIVSLQVEVRVHDVHQHRPVFLQNSYKAQISEFSDVGTSVVAVSAVDRDERDKLSYTIYSATNVNSMAKFNIHPDSGKSHYITRCYRSICSV